MSSSTGSKSAPSTNPTSVSAGSTSSSRSSDQRRGPAKYPSSVQSSVLSSGSKDAFKDIQKLLDLLHEYKIPGPRLLRLKTEFKDHVGSGTQGQVRAASKHFAESLALAASSQDKRLVDSADYWPSIVIKRLRISDRAGQNRSPEEKLKLVADSALSEVQSLCRAKRLQNELHKMSGHQHSTSAPIEAFYMLPASVCPSMCSFTMTMVERADYDLEKFMLDKSLYSTLSFADKCSIAYDIGSGLSAIHADGLCHGDLKPANILVFDGGFRHSRPGRRRWYAKICDFGSARPATDASAHGDYLGTPSWLPPEKHDESRAKKVSLQLCDIFAYGLVTWAWFLGNPASPIEDFEPSTIVKDIGRQEFYKRAREAIRRVYQPAATRTRQDREHQEEVHRQTQLNFSQGRDQSQWAQTSPVVGFIKLLERWSKVRQAGNTNRAGRFLEPDFGSDTNRILAALALALDEQPHRRNVVQPHTYFEDTVEQVFAVLRPATFAEIQEKSSPDTGIAWESSSMTRARRVLSTARGNLTKAIAMGANKLMLSLKQVFPALIAGGLRQRVFEDFHAIFVDVLGFDTDTDEILQHPLEERCVTLRLSNVCRMEKLLRKYCSTEQGITIRHAEYALARLRSRFQPCCWKHMFSDAHETYQEICDRLEMLELYDFSSSAAWALRRKTASDFQSTDDKSYDVAAFFSFLTAQISDEQRTFRMLLLLEKNFYLGQAADHRFPGKSFFYQYLHSLSNFQEGVQLCRHFRRVAAQDWTTPENKQFYTGSLDAFNADRTEHSDSKKTETYQNTCLHDAVRMGNYAVVEYLVRTGFFVTARDGEGRTAYELAIQMVRQRNLRPDKEIVDLLSQHPSNATFRSKLPLGWEEIPVADSTVAYIETSIEDDLYPITFQTPLQGFFQNRNIALAQRKVQGEDDMTFVLNPLRFLRAPKDLDAESKPAERTFFDDAWYSEDMRKTREPEVKAVDDERVWYRRFAEVGDYTRRLLWSISIIRGDLFLLFVPLCALARILKWSVGVQLAFSILATAPLVSLFLHQFDKINQARPDFLAALITCFPEAVIAAVCLYYDYTTLCLDLVIGSIICNNLLVFGIAHWVIRDHQLFFVVTSASTLTSLNTFGPFCSVLLYILYATRDETFPSRTSAALVLLSRAMAIICVATNLLYLLFRLKTHVEIFGTESDSEDEEAGGRNSANVGWRLLRPVTNPWGRSLHRATPLGSNSLGGIQEDAEAEAQEILDARHAERGLIRRTLTVIHQLLPWRRITALVIIAGLAIFTTATIASNIVLLPRRQSRLLILLGLPALTKFWTHVESLELAFSHKIDRVIDRFLGASVQMTLLVAPCLIFLAWASRVPLTLRFDVLETVAYAFSAWFVALLLRDGRTNYLNGVVLICLYTMLALGAFYFYNA